MAKLSLLWLRESCTGSPGKWSDWVCSSIWLSSCCLPRRLPAEERFCSYQRQVTCLESSCHQFSSQSGPREHLSPPLNWLQHLIKALLRDDVDRNDVPLLRRRLKQNVHLITTFTPCLGIAHTNLLHIPNWASTFEHYCYILSTFQPVVRHLSCQPLYSQPPTFPSIVNLIPQWLEDKELTRPLWSHIPDAASRQRATNSSTFYPEGLHKRVFSIHNILLPF